MNILILSCGTRNKIVQYFKKELTSKGNVIATDCSALAPALYEADKHYVVPRMTESGYVECILDICGKENIDGVFSLIDPELSLLARERKRFADAGVTVIGSSYDVCEIALDKWAMYQWLVEHGYDTAKSFMDKESFYCAVDKGEISYPVIVKPVRGSASFSVHKVHSREMLEVLLATGEKLMIQQYLDGIEIGADCYIDMVSRDVVSIFTKKKLLMRAGETDKAVSFKDDTLFGLLCKFVKECGISGQIDIDVFDVGGHYYISEVNPRFGGGYPHAYECGVNIPSMIVNNLAGNVNQSVIGQYDEGVYMMKYNEVKAIRADKRGVR